MANNFRVTPVRSRVAVLASGGLDSGVLLAEMARRGRRVSPLYVRAGLKWESAELAALQRFLGALGRKNIAPVIELRLPMDDMATDHWSVTGRQVPGYRAATASNYIAGRNLSLLAKAAVFCSLRRIGEIAMAPLESNPFPDARPEFFRSFERTAELGLGLRLRVTTPFLGLTKAQVIRRGRALPLELTLSCARPRGALHCGACTKCAERIGAFAASGIDDPTRYARRPRASRATVN
ncbi:MAG TPA: 7-cyano-7-deazaguanine synthase [Candidatus Binataceae bacterium]